MGLSSVLSWETGIVSSVHYDLIPLNWTSQCALGWGWGDKDCQLTPRSAKKKKKKKEGVGRIQAQWCSLLILNTQEAEVCEFKANLVYKVNSKTGLHILSQSKDKMCMSILPAMCRICLWATLSTLRQDVSGRRGRGVRGSSYSSCLSSQHPGD